MFIYYLLAVLFIIYLTIWLVIIFKYKTKLNAKVFNLVFSLIIAISYIALLIYNTQALDIFPAVFDKTLPTGNISPFMFSLVLITIFLPTKLKDIIYTLIVLLSVGMFGAGLNELYSSLSFPLFSLFFPLDILSHFTLFLFGIYLVVSKQVDLNKKNVIKAIILIYSVIFIMIILNAIFKTCFFGLSFDDTHNIYDMTFIKNEYLNILVYIILVFIVLMGGYILNRIIKRITVK